MVLGTWESLSATGRFGMSVPENSYLVKYPEYWFYILILQEHAFVCVCARAHTHI